MPSHRVQISNLVTHSQETYEVAELDEGDTYYVDRDFKFGALPSFLRALNGIKTANADKTADGKDGEFLCFDVEEKVRVYILYDNRISSTSGVEVPTWLKENFVDRHEDVTEVSGDDAMGYFEIWSSEFNAGQVCLGGNGCTGSCSNYMVFVGPQELEPFFPGSAKASARYFDGSSDYVLLPAMRGDSVEAKGSFDVLTIDTWIKWFDVTGNHPIMCEDHWSPGALHYQIYNSEFGFDVNSAGDQTFQWQPQPLTWYYISVTYSSQSQFIKLSINSEPMETLQCPTCTVPIKLDSPRIGAWLDGSDSVARSMHGEMSVFRIWSVETDGVDVCPPALADGLVAQYIFGAGGDTARDTSGHAYDGVIHDAGWSDELPPSQQCQKQGFGLSVVC